MNKSLGPVYKSSLGDRQKANPLIVACVGSKAETVKTQWVAKYPTIDFLIYTYSAMEDTAEFLDVKRYWSKYNNTTVYPKMGSGCKLDMYKHAFKQFLANGIYTHLWMIDSDLDTSKFSMKKLLSDLREYAPLLSQPAILPVSISDGGTGRSSDHYWLRAPMEYKTITAPRSLGRAHPRMHRELNLAPNHLHSMYRVKLRNQKTIEPMTPILDRLIVNAVADVCSQFDGTSDWAYAFVMMACSEIGADLVYEFTGSTRNARIVYDGNPLVHLDTRTINITSVCKRELLDSVTDTELEKIKSTLLANLEDNNCTI